MSLTIFSNLGNKVLYSIKSWFPKMFLRISFAQFIFSPFFLLTYPFDCVWLCDTSKNKGKHSSKWTTKKANNASHLPKGTNRIISHLQSRVSVIQWWWQVRPAVSGTTILCCSSSWWSNNRQSWCPEGLKCVTLIHSLKCALSTLNNWAQIPCKPTASLLALYITPTPLTSLCT